MNLLVWVILQKETGEFLLGRRDGSAYGHGLWGLPGGQVEGREGLPEAARREVREEVGLELGNLEVLGVRRYDVEVRGVDFLFRCRDWQGEPRPLDKTSEVGWFTLDHWPADALPWLKPVLEQHLQHGYRVSQQLGNPENTTGF